MKQTLNEVIQWAEEVGIIEHSTEFRQTLKVSEEWGEFCRCLFDNRREDAKIELGDVTIVCAIIAKLMGTDLEECMRRALEKNKSRKGKISKHGNYIKEEDIKIGKCSEDVK